VKTAGIACGLSYDLRAGLRDTLSVKLLEYPDDEKDPDYDSEPVLLQYSSGGKLSSSHVIKVFPIWRHSEPHEWSKESHDGEYLDYRELNEKIFEHKAAKHERHDGGHARLHPEFADSAEPCAGLHQKENDFNG